MGDRSQNAVVAVNPELGQDAAVLMQNLWRQAKSRIPIAVNLAFFTKSVPVSPPLSTFRPSPSLTSDHQADAGAGLIAAIVSA
jgi:hypothetical protein